MKQLSIHPMDKQGQAMIMWMDKLSGGNIILSKEELHELFIHMKPCLIRLGYDIEDL